MKILLRLLIGFLAVAMIVLITGIIGLNTADNIMENSDFIVEEEMPLKDISMEAIIAVTRGNDYAKEYLLNSDGLEEIKENIDKSVEDYGMFMDMIRYGTESSEFKNSIYGELYAKEGITIKSKKASAEILKMVEEADDSHEKFDKAIHDLVDVRNEILKYNFDYAGKNWDFLEFINLVQLQHKVWLEQLYDAARTNTHFTGTLDHTQCFFGKWFYAYKIDDEGLNKLLDELEPLHDELHASGKKVNDATSAQKMVIYENEIVPVREKIEKKFVEIVDYIEPIIVRLNNEQEQKLNVLESSYNEIESILEDLEMKVDSEIETAMIEADNTQKFGMRMIIISIIVGVILSVLIGLYMAFGISKPLKNMEDTILKVSEGDMTQKVENKSSITELKTISSAFNNMVDKVGQLIKNIKKSIETSAASSEELSASAEEVNASIEQVTSTVSEIAKGSQELSKSSSAAAEKSKKTEESSSQGAQSAKTVSDSMMDISKSTKEGAEKIKALGSKSEKIGEIIETINNISEQTNLLALNAAIEAARAGEAGRGFAVVADEVRKLAEESSKATAQISDLISGIQQEINSSVETMDVNMKTVEETSNSVAGAVTSFEQIPELVKEVNSAISSISAVAEENAAGAQEVNASVEQVSSAMQQVAQTSQELSKGSEELKNMVDKFKV